MNINLQHEDNRIFAQNDIGELIAEITFPKVSDNTVSINHTFVHESLRGQGIADMLMQAAIKVIQEKKYNAVVSCSYAKSWVAKHPEFKSIFINQY